MQRVGDPCPRFWHWRSQTIDRSRRTDVDKATFDRIDASGLTKEDVLGCGTLEEPVKGLRLSGPFKWDQTDHDQEQFRTNGDDQPFVHGGAKHGRFI